MQKIIRIGARRSALSRWQAEHIATLLRAEHSAVAVEIRAYQTRGDQYGALPLPAIGGKGLFTAALEKALRRGEIDCAVHSLKDLPVEDAPGLAIGATPERGDARDALVSRSGQALADLPAGARIGTGSPRRAAQLLTRHPDLQIAQIRGNVPTRLAKLQAADSEYDALVLAAAGLRRLGLAGQINEIFSAEQMLSAAGQGALALQCRADAADLAFFAPLRHPPTALAVTAERAFLRALGGGCSLPVGAYAVCANGSLQLRGRVLTKDGRQQIDVSGAVALPADSAAALALGARLAQAALEKGARQLLAASAASGP